VGTRDDVDSHEFANAPGRGRARIRRGFHRADVTAHENRDVCGANIFLGDQDYVGRLDHRIGGFNSTDEALRLNHSECVSGHLMGCPSRVNARVLRGTLAELRSIIPYEMRRVSFASIALAIAVLISSACSRPADTAPAQVARPEVTVDHSDAPVASPLEMTYRFLALPGVSLSQDYTVFVHFIDADGELMWTDDHKPPVPTSQWKPGMAVEYARTMFIPKFPYEGASYVEVGLYLPSTGERVKMDGESTGQREYRVASFNLHLQSDAPFMVFTEGWHEAEVSGEGSGVEWQWTRKEGTLAVKNPMRDALLYLQVDQPVAGQGAHHVDVRIGPTVIDAFDLTPGLREVRKIPISKDQFGDMDPVTVSITPDKTFVPAAIPSLRNTDTRELGVRVFRAYLQPK